MSDVGETGGAGLGIGHVHYGEAHERHIRRVRLDEDRITDVRGAARLSEEPRRQVDGEGRGVVVDASSFQIALLRLGRLLAVVVVPLGARAGHGGTGNAALGGGQDSTTDFSTGSMPLDVSYFFMFAYYVLVW